MCLHLMEESQVVQRLSSSEMDTATRVWILKEDVCIHVELIPLGRVYIQLFSPQLCVNSKPD